MDLKTIVVMEGDQTGQELLEEALRVLDPAVTGLDVEFVRYDLSLENRRATGNEVCLLYTSPSPRDRQKSRMPSSA